MIDKSRHARARPGLDGVVPLTFVATNRPQPDEEEMPHLGKDRWRTNSSRDSYGSYTSPESGGQVRRSLGRSVGEGGSAWRIGTRNAGEEKEAVRHRSTRKHRHAEGWRGRSMLDWRTRLIADCGMGLGQLKVECAADEEVQSMLVSQIATSTQSVRNQSH